MIRVYKTLMTQSPGELADWLNQLAQEPFPGDRPFEGGRRFEIHSISTTAWETVVWITAVVSRVEEEREER